VRGPPPAVSTGCFLPPATEGATVRSRPDGRTSFSRRRRWRHSPRAAGRGHQLGCRFQPGEWHRRSAPPRMLTASSIRSFRKGPPKPSSYSSFNLPLFSGETSKPISKLVEPYVGDEDHRTFKNVMLNIPSKMGSCTLPNGNEATSERPFDCAKSILR